MVAGLGEVALVDAVVEGEVVLAGHGPGHAVLVAEHAEHGEAEGVLVAQAPVFDELRVEEALDRQHLPLEVREVTRRVLRLLVALRREPVRPPKGLEAHARREVEHVEIQRAAPEPRDRRLAARPQAVRVVAVGFPGLDGAALPGRVALRREVEVVALHRAALRPGREPVAHPRLRRPTVVPAHGVELRRVEEVDALADERVELGVGLRLVGVEGAPVHRAGADLGDHHVAGAVLDLAQRRHALQWRAGSHGRRAWRAGNSCGDL
mmetsp:Transcript_19259/g.66792  ORF Transcript_19259/g.66792 Transcript_19259/m.66792 type:complete len:265 (+) Transcript_19259:456-1250(+)